MVHLTTKRNLNILYTIESKSKPKRQKQQRLQIAEYLNLGVIMCQWNASLGVRIEAHLIWIPNEEDNHNNCHRHAVKDVHCPLMHQRISIIVHNIFDDPEDRTHQDQGTDGIQHVQCLLPGDPRLETLRGRCTTKTSREDNGSHPEKGKGDKLNCQTGNDTHLSPLGVSQHGKRRGVALDDERQHIAPDKGLGES